MKLLRKLAHLCDCDRDGWLQGTEINLDFGCGVGLLSYNLCLGIGFCPHRLRGDILPRHMKNVC